jgi:hypothetical protein
MSVAATAVASKWVLRIALRTESDCMVASAAFAQGVNLLAQATLDLNSANYAGTAIKKMIRIAARPADDKQ